MLSAAVPSAAPLLVKMTVPVGAPLALVTVAISVTVCPKVDGLGEAASAVVMVA